MERVGSIDNAKPGVLEFFAGIGLARIGLEAAGFRVTWANDFDPDKKAMYEAQFEDAGDHVFALGDIGKITADELPRDAALAWASSPCTDLSLAGGRAGLAGNQSGTFWHFVRLLEELEDGRPQIAVLENVTGLATSHGGDDLIAAIKAFNRLGYSVDALAIDARRFLPQSRPRLFLVGAQNPPADSPERDFELRPDWLQWIYDDSSLQTHRAPLPLPPLLESTGCIGRSKSFPQTTTGGGATDAVNPSWLRYHRFNANDWIFLNQKKEQITAPPIEELEEAFRCGRCVPMIFQDASEPLAGALPNRLWSSWATDAYKSGG